MQVGEEYYNRETKNNQVLSVNKQVLKSRNQCVQ